MQRPAHIEGLSMICFDSNDPPALARFWAELLGGERTVDEDGDAWVVLPTGGPRLDFLRVSDDKTVKNRLHLDVRVGAGLTGDERVSALEAEAARLGPLGARRLHLLPADEENEACLVMQDVEGNEFCLD